MFLKFNTSEQRRAYGGSAFLELQYCDLPVGTPEETLTSSNSIRFWNTASLYIYSDDLNAFYSEYQAIFNNGTNSLDLYGINYYSAERAAAISNEIEAKRPCAYDVLLKWIRENPYNNGFYILGI